MEQMHTRRGLCVFAGSSQSQPASASGGTEFFSLHRDEDAASVPDQMLDDLGPTPAGSRGTAQIVPVPVRGSPASVLETGSRSSQPVISEVSAVVGPQGAYVFSEETRMPQEVPLHGSPSSAALPHQIGRNIDRARITL